jgi:uncharacterized protein (DUF433 family)
MMSTTFPTTTSYEHIRLDDRGVPFIAGTTMKVVEVVMAQKAYGWSPEELHFQHPYLTMSQIHIDVIQLKLEELSPKPYSDTGGCAY